MVDDNFPILAELNALFPLSVVAVSPYFGTFVCIDLLDAYKNPVRVRIYLTDWMLKEGGLTLTTCYSSPDEWQGAFAALAGTNLTELAWIDQQRLQLIFESGKMFILDANFEQYERADHLVTIYAPDRFNVVYSPELGFEKELLAM